MQAAPGLFGEVARDWREQLEIIVEMTKEMSRQTDPQEMSRAYGQRMQTLRPTDRMVSISRRGMKHPWYRVTRSSSWKEPNQPLERSGSFAAAPGRLVRRTTLQR